MPSKGKVKGSAYERELVKQFQSYFHEAKRSWGSNGQSLGLHEEVDLLVKNNDGLELKIQAKRRKKLPNFLGLTEHVDAAIFREDNDESYIMLRLKDFIERIY